MDLQTAKINQDCPREEIALYLDGELTLAEELLLENHLAACQTCRTEINLHKKMFSVLDLAFEGHQEVELPKNFAKIVATKAESNVSGLRSKEERFRALIIGLGLFLLTLIGLSIESDRFFPALGVISGQVVTVITIGFRMFSDFAVGLAIVSRCVSQQIFFSSMFPVILAVCLVALMTFTFSRLRMRFSRS
jgi:predicted anti-sigma-YlaC factor YlaD